MVIVDTELCLYFLLCLSLSFAKFFIYYVGNDMASMCGLLLDLSMFLLSTSLPYKRQFSTAIFGYPFLC